jgi:putative tryptophan/tyrosine transport system substrate-binding protein
MIERRAFLGTVGLALLAGQRDTAAQFQQATRFELVINLKTAHALGVTIPPELRARADEMIGE